MAKTSINMLEGSIWDKVILFAIPLAITSILQQLFNSVDLAVVGQFVGKEALAAVGANGIIINLSVNLFVGLSIGTNVVCANMLGSRNYLKVKQAVHTSIIMAAVSGIALAVFGVIFARDALELLDTPADIMDLAVLYLQICMGGLPAFMLYNFSAAILRSKGDTKRPLIVMLISGCVNVALNLLFVLYFGMSVDGVAYATIISTAFAAVILLWLLSKETGPLQVRWQKFYVDWNWDILINICKVGVPAGLQGMVFSFSNIVIQIALNNIGAEAIAATAVALNYEFLAFFILSAFAQACTTFVGQNYGARNLPRCREITVWCLKLNFVTTIAVSAVCCIFTYPLVQVFTTDPLVVEYAVLRIRYILALEVINTIMETLSCAMRGLNYSMYPAVICMFGVCGVRIIYIYTYFAAHPSFDVLMWIYPISWAVTNVGILIAYFHVLRQVEKKFANLA